MIRSALGLFVVSLVIVLVIAVRGDPGDATLTWLGWQVKTTAAAGALIIGLLTLAATLFWQGLVWILQAPARAARANALKRRRQADELLTRGFLSVAAGDGVEARRLAQRAADAAEDTPKLVRILTAQAAEAAGDPAAAKAAYSAMLGFADMRLAAHRGLMQTALAEGHASQAEAHAQAAFDLPRTAPWAWRAVLGAQLKGADWPAALGVVQTALDRKVISPLIAERARAALYCASRQDLDLLTTAARTRPDFTPAAVLASQALAAEGRPQRAAPLLEAAWKARAHPAVWMAYRDLRPDETPKQRATRLAALADLNPDTTEAKVLRVEQALIAADALAATGFSEALDLASPSRRLAGLMARVAFAAGRTDEARAWIARGASGAEDTADWSDIDEHGRLFAYGPADWARLIVVYAETGELAHPRHDRGGVTLTDLPRIPTGYAESTPFIAPGDSGDPFPPIVDDGDFGEALQPAETAPQKPRGLLRRVTGR